MTFDIFRTRLEELLYAFGKPDAAVTHGDGEIRLYTQEFQDHSVTAIIVSTVSAVAHQEATDQAAKGDQFAGVLDSLSFKTLQPPERSDNCSHPHEIQVSRLALVWARTSKPNQHVPIADHRCFGNVLEIYSMGDERMLLNGRPVILRMRKAIEIITYLLEQGSVTLDKLLTDVFPEGRRRTSRSYFHQVKQEVKVRLPELKIVFDAKARRYSVETDLMLRWDVAELREGRAMGAMGLFLPTSGSEWALELNQELEELKEELGLVGRSKRRREARQAFEKFLERH